MTHHPAQKPKNKKAANMSLHHGREPLLPRRKVPKPRPERVARTGAAPVQERPRRDVLATLRGPARARDAAHALRGDALAPGAAVRRAERLVALVAGPAQPAVQSRARVALVVHAAGRPAAADRVHAVPQPRGGEARRVHTARAVLRVGLAGALFCSRKYYLTFKAFFRVLNAFLVKFIVKEILFGLLEFFKVFWLNFEENYLKNFKFQQTTPKARLNYFYAQMAEQLGITSPYKDTVLVGHLVGGVSRGYDFRSANLLQFIIKIVGIDLK